MKYLLNLLASLLLAASAVAQSTVYFSTNSGGGNNTSTLALASADVPLTVTKFTFGVTSALPNDFKVYDSINHTHRYTNSARTTVTAASGFVTNTLTNAIYIGISNGVRVTNLWLQTNIYAVATFTSANVAAPSNELPRMLTVNGLAAATPGSYSYFTIEGNWVFNRGITVAWVSNYTASVAIEGFRH